MLNRTLKAEEGNESKRDEAKRDESRPCSWLRRCLPGFTSPLTLSEVSGGLGDLGTLIPLTLAMQRSGGIEFVPALFFAGLFNVATGAVWDVPMCVQPMKTIAAVAVAEGLTQSQVEAHAAGGTAGDASRDECAPSQVALAGMLVSAMVFLLGASRGIVVINNMIPASVVKGTHLEDVVT